jgi:hypothetical protein
MLVGIPQTRITLTGTINGSNKDFVLASEDGPIYPKRGVSVTPQPEDVTCETLKHGTPDVYTEVEVDSISTVEDTETGDLIYCEVNLHSAPEAASVDHVVLTYVEQLRPYIAQSIKIDAKQDSKDAGELGSSIKRTSYGAQTITITEDMIMSDFDINKKMLFEPYAGGYTPEDGYEVYEFISEPATRYVCVPVYTGAAAEQDGSFVGAYYFVGKIVPKGLGDVKDGDNITNALEFSVDSAPLLVLPE